MLVSEIIFSIILVITSIFVISLVIMQDGKQQNDTTISGGSADSYYSKNQTRTKDVILNKITKVAAIVFFIALIAVNAITIFLK